MWLDHIKRTLKLRHLLISPFKRCTLFFFLFHFSLKALYNKGKRKNMSWNDFLGPDFISTIHNNHSNESGLDYFDVHMPPILHPSVSTATSIFNADLLQSDILTSTSHTQSWILSELTKAFVSRLQHLLESRAESDVFTGEDIINVLQTILPNTSYTQGHCFTIARRLMESHLFKSQHEYSLSRGSDTTCYSFRTDIIDKMAYPVGVISNLAPCYVPKCIPGDPRCYSPSCPNKFCNMLQDLNRGSAFIDLEMINSQFQNIQMDEDTSERNSPAIKEAYPELDERERQVAIKEFFQYEERYQEWFEFMRKKIITPLQRDNIISKSRRHELVGYIFKYFDPVRRLSTEFCESLKHRRYEYLNGPIPQIGDLIYAHLLACESALTDYAAHIPLANTSIASEKRNNRMFADFVLRLEQQRDLQFAWSNTTAAAAGDLYVSQPYHHVCGYAGHLQKLLRTTHNNHPDHRSLKDSDAKVRRIVETLDGSMRDAAKRVSVIRLQQSLIDSGRDREYYDLKLTHTERRILWEGKLKYSSINKFGIMRSSYRYVHILDHALLVTKSNDNGVTHQIKTTPIPLLMLQWSFTRTSNSVYIVGFSHLYKRSEEELRFTCDEDTKVKLNQAIISGINDLKRKGPFKKITIDAATFRRPLGKNGGGSSGIICSTPLGEKAIAIGTEKGVWVKREDDIYSRPIINTNGRAVKQIVAMAGWLLVLTDAGSLFYFALESINAVLETSGSSLSSRNYIPCPYIDSFEVRPDGIFVYKHKDTVAGLNFHPEFLTRTDRVFLETPPHFGSSSNVMPAIVQRSNMKAIRRDGIKRIQLAGNYVFLVCRDHFIKIDGENNHQVLPKQQHRGQNALAIFCLSEKRFLLCYDRSVYYVDAVGSVIRSDKTHVSLFEWECQPQRVILFHDHLIAFSRNAIEIRELKTVSDDFVHLFCISLLTCGCIRERWFRYFMVKIVA
ncbi:hypothetical protein BX666DRAFT_1998565 [Dichotomocladium elegans]|nr:hypothetical protein BX666DRAFT_1998565 [Dichotomocladium elegans]